jgi:hypothetical protein
VPEHLVHEAIQNLRDTYPILADILYWVLTTCSDENFPLPDNLTNHHIHVIYPTHSNLIDEQSTIGWKQTIKGCWATQWVQHIDLISPGKGERVMRALTINLWQVVLKLWTDPCDIFHQDDHKSNNIWKKQLRPKVQAIYDFKDQLDSIDKRVLATPIEDTLKLQKNPLQDWI